MAVLELPFEKRWPQTPRPDLCLVTGEPGAPWRAAELTSPIPWWAYALLAGGFFVAISPLFRSAPLVFLAPAWKLGLAAAVAGLLSLMLVPKTAVLHLPLRDSIPPGDPRVQFFWFFFGDGYKRALDCPITLLAVRGERFVLEVPSETGAEALRNWLAAGDPLSAPPRGASRAGTP